eukprot:UN04204
MQFSGIFFVGKSYKSNMCKSYIESVIFKDFIKKLVTYIYFPGRVTSIKQMNVFFKSTYGEFETYFLRFFNMRWQWVLSMVILNKIGL